MDTIALFELLDRIASALEAANEAHDHLTPEIVERQTVALEKSVDNQRREVEARELHNQLHLSGTAHQAPS